MRSTPLENLMTVLTYTKKLASDNPEELLLALNKIMDRNIKFLEGKVGELTFRGQYKDPNDIARHINACFSSESAVIKQITALDMTTHLSYRLIEFSNNIKAAFDDRLFDKLKAFWGKFTDNPNKTPGELTREKLVAELHTYVDETLMVLKHIQSISKDANAFNLDDKLKQIESLIVNAPINQYLEAVPEKRRFNHVKSAIEHLRFFSNVCKINRMVDDNPKYKVKEDRDDVTNVREIKEIKAHLSFSELYNHYKEQGFVDRALIDVATILSSSELREIMGLRAIVYTPATLQKKMKDRMSSPNFNRGYYQRKLHEAIRSNAHTLKKEVIVKSILIDDHNIGIDRHSM